MSYFVYAEGYLIALSEWVNSELQFSGKVFPICTSRINISEALHFSHTVYLLYIFTINSNPANVINWLMFIYKITPRLVSEAETKLL
jgi:hypothetical protein